MIVEVIKMAFPNEFKQLKDKWDKHNIDIEQVLKDVVLNIQDPKYTILDDPRIGHLDFFQGDELLKDISNIMYKLRVMY